MPIPVLQPDLSSKGKGVGATMRVVVVGPTVEERKFHAGDRTQRVDRRAIEKSQSQKPAKRSKRGSESLPPKPELG